MIYFRTGWSVPSPFQHVRFHSRPDVESLLLPTNPPLLLQITWLSASFEIEDNVDRSADRPTGLLLFCAKDR